VAEQETDRLRATSPASCRLALHLNGTFNFQGQLSKDILSKILNARCSPRRGFITATEDPTIASTVANRDHEPRLGHCFIRAPQCGFHVPLTRALSTTGKSKKGQNSPGEWQRPARVGLQGPTRGKWMARILQSTYGWFRRVASWSTGAHKSCS
jgi:hypothetical protein